MENPSTDSRFVEIWAKPSLGGQDLILSDLNLASHCPLDNGQHDTIPVQSLGQLDLLPLEILTEILLLIDVISLTDFRRVNKRAMQTVDSIPQYQIIYQQCPDILRGAISIQAKFFDFGTLYRALCQTKCSTCSDFGGYLYLITCQRVCRFCYTEHKRFLPLLGKYASALSRLSRKNIRQFPFVRTLPGRYADGGGQQSRSRMTLWDREAILANSTETSYSEKQDRFCNNPRRFMAIMYAPYFEPPSKAANWGLFCIGCSESSDKDTYFRKQYTREGFIKHILHYGPVELEYSQDRGRH